MSVEDPPAHPLPEVVGFDVSTIFTCYHWGWGFINPWALLLSMGLVIHTSVPWPVIAVEIPIVAEVKSAVAVVVVAVVVW